MEATEKNQNGPKHISKRFRWIFGLMLGLVAITVVGALLAVKFLPTMVKEDTNLLAIVGSEKIYKSDLARKAYAEGLTGDLSDPDLPNKKGYDEEWKKNALEALIEEAGVRQIAQREEVTVTDEEVKTKASNLKEYPVLTQEQLSVYHREIKAMLLLEKLRNKLLTYKKGRYVVIRFDKHMTIDPTLPAATIQARKASQEADIKKDREYADALKDSIYKKLTSKEITFDQAMQIVREDKFIDWKNFDFTISDPGVTFDTANSPVGFKISKDGAFEKAITETGKGEIAEPFLKKLDYAPDGQPEDYRDSMWTILTVDEEYEGVTKDFDKWLDEEINKLGVSNKNRVTQLINQYISKAYAYNPSNCTGGRDDQGSSHPGDVIIETRYYGTDVNNAHSNATAYIRPSADAYDYSGCPEPDSGEDFVVSKSVIGDGGSKYFYGSENANSSGCIYRFSSVASTTINQCCGDSHNSHVVMMRNESDSTSYVLTHGGWHHYFHSNSDGSSWGDALYGSFDDSNYGARESGRIVFSVVNGETQYLRGYWWYQVNTAPSISAVAPAKVSGVWPTYTTSQAVTLSATASDANSVPSADDINQKVAIQRSGDNGATWGGYTYYETGLTTQGQKNVKSFAAGTLEPGLYKWVVTAVDEHGLYNAQPTGSPNMWSHNNPFYFRVAEPNVAPEITLNSPTHGSSFIEGTTVPLRATATDDNGDTVKVQIEYARSGASTWTVACAYDSTGWMTQPYSKTCNTPNNLTPGSYAWRAFATDGSLSALSPLWYFTIIDTGMACSVNPASGPVPFVVDIATTYSGITPPFTYNMGEGGADISRGANFSYTYNNANPGGYSVTICHPSYLDADDGDHCETCTPNPIIPTNPATGGGGEVAP